MVTSTFASINLTGFTTLVVDEKTTYNEVAQDIERGRLTLEGVHTCMLMIGRQEVISGTDLMVGLVRLENVLKQKQLGT